ncbi:MAG: AmmeMemoRadiSam system protein B [Patescibacteria group bacterium]|jgi:poly-gamma-glutamate synthesis protein (capsule biosynthesis protein)|nr:AmmeMemoRadiSam system protein B [Patescibacteria group bacterium]
MDREEKLLLLVIVASLSLIGLLALGVCLFNVSHRPAPIVDYFELPARDFHYANPADLKFYQQLYNFPGQDFDLAGSQVFGGVIPHHLLAGDLIADFFRQLEGQDFDLIVLLGPNHFSAGQSDLIASAYDWQTPYGILSPDQAALNQLKDELNLAVEEKPFAAEHSINVEVAFIKKTFRHAKFLPIIIKPGVDQTTAGELAEALFKISQSKKMLLLVSADFSHYQTSDQAQLDDQASIKALTNFDLEKIYSLAVDSPPAVYALLKYGQLYHASFQLLNNSNSAILSNQPDLPSTTSYITGFLTNQVPPVSLKMLFFGDLMLDRHVKELINSKGFDYIFSDLNRNNFFMGYDLVGANLEGVVTDGGQHYDPVKEFDFAFDPKDVAALKKYHFTFFNLANNHIFDQGQRGIDETNSNLTALGFDYAGCPDGQVADCSWRILTLDNQQIALVGFSGVGAKLNPNLVAKMIIDLRFQVDWIIINIHWGQEYQLQPNEMQRHLAHQLIESGADVVIGHHPHVVQGLEVYQGKPIFYSLGNFVFDQYFSQDTQTGLALSLNFLNTEVNYELWPLVATKGQLKLLIGNERQDFLAKLEID